MRTTETTTHKFYLDEEEKELISDMYDLLTSIDRMLPYYDKNIRLVSEGEEMTMDIENELDAATSFMGVLNNLDYIAWTDGDDDD